MELVLLIGIPATGKSTFCRQRLYDTHMRLSLDVLKTRRREWRLFEACLAAKAKVVIDNTNVTAAERARYLVPARAAGYRCVGYYFRSVLAEALERNARRNGSLPPKRQVPLAGVGGMAGRLELPRAEEGFEELWFVRIEEEAFIVEPWQGEESPCDRML